MTVKEDRLARLESELSAALDRIVELEESEERLRLAESERLREKQFADSALDSLPGVFYLFDEDGTFVRWNRNFRVVTEYSDEELSSMKATDFFTGEDRETIARRVGKTFIDGRADAEAHFTTRSGKRIPYYFTGHLLESGGRRYLVGMGLDISERRAMEGALRESEKRFRQLFTRNLAGVYRTTPEGLILDCNMAFANILGYASPEELFSIRAQDLYHSLGERKAFLDKLMERGSLTNYEFRLRRKDGKTVWLLMNASYLADADGEPPVIQGTIVDITGSKEALEDLRQSEAKYHSLVDHSNDAIYLLHDGRFEVINSKFEEIFGVTREDVRKPDFSFLDLVAPKCRDLILERGRRIARGEPVDQNYEFTALHRDGHQVEVEVSVAHVPFRGGTASQGILRDVTERKRLEAELRQAQKMEAVGRLAGGVAHDFNNIMTCILGNADLVLSQLDSDPGPRENLEEIITAANRAASLTRQLLAFSRRQVVQPVVLDLNVLVADMEKMLRRLISEDVDLVTRLRPEPCCVEADPGQMEQVLMNLAVNARDAMPRGGRLTIETELRKLKSAASYGQVTVPSGDYALLTVSDTGMGMEEHVLENIFEPFFTTKEVGEGTGLGLSMVFGCVKQARGYIIASSTPGERTDFTIFLPRVNESIETGCPAPTVAGAASGRETVLVVEDDLRVLSLVRAALQNHGYIVLAAEDGAEGLQCLESHAGPVDLLITDVVMPKMNGRELADRATTLHPEMRVIFTSGYTGNVIFREGFLEHGAEFLPKPFTPQALMRRIRAVLDGQPR